MKGVEVYLQDILESILLIRRYTRGKTLKTFDQDTELQDAVIRRLEIIGEAVKRIPAGMKSEHVSIPWKSIAGMRDMLIHEYAGVSVETVWRTIKHDLLPLKRVIMEMIKATSN